MPPTSSPVTEGSDSSPGSPSPSSDRDLTDQWRKNEPRKFKERYEWLRGKGKRGGQGRVYQQVKERYLEKIRVKEMTGEQVADELGVSRQAVMLAVHLLRAEAMEPTIQAEWEYRTQEDRWGQYIDIYAMDDGELEDVADYFAEWRSRHFLTPQGIPYVTKAFHRRWIVAILRAIRDHRNLLILSPPRHGKTELLIHFDIFFITRVNPNISIVRVCKSEGLAKRALSSGMDHLENNEGLRVESLKPGQEYQPPLRSGKPWNAGEFTVATRTITGLKSPTVAAVGAGGTLLSRDGDIFVVDDIEDQQTVYTAEMREKRRNWFATDLMSRRVDNNCVIYIGSRQHPDDIPGHLISNPEWEVIVESAHDEGGCLVEEPDKKENWDQHVDCMLWPEMRGYGWLMGIKYDPERASTYPMIYLNQPTDEEVDLFSRSTVDAAKDERRTYHPELPHATLNVPESFYDSMGIYHPIRLIAGLDPSGSGYQASWLWAVDLAAFKLYAVDYENRLGGGLHRAAEVIQRWGSWYGVRTWVIEENLYHGAFMKDETLRSIASRDGLTLLPHETGTNKWDQGMGVGVLAKMMMSGDVSIPWGSVESQAKWRLACSQFINFSRDKRRSRTGRSSVNVKTDIVMASWFPLATMQRWRRDWLAEKVEEQSDEGYPFEEMGTLYTDIFSTMVR